MPETTRAAPAGMQAGPFFVATHVSGGRGVSP